MTWLLFTLPGAHDSVNKYISRLRITASWVLTSSRKAAYVIPVVYATMRRTAS